MALKEAWGRGVHRLLGVRAESCWCSALGPGTLVTQGLDGLPCILGLGVGRALGSRSFRRLPGRLSLSAPPSRKMATNFLVHEKVWFDKFKYDDAERKFYEQMNGPVAGSSRQVGVVGGCACTGRLVGLSRWLAGPGVHVRPGTCGLAGPAGHAPGALSSGPAELSFCIACFCFST